MKTTIEDVYREIGDCGIEITPDMRVSEVEKAGEIANRVGLSLVLSNCKPELRWEL